ncbi:MAG: thiolase family protein [Chloroflexi bacterium]|nr:thiolase family protein [Chloroflexota bacterium]
MTDSIKDTVAIVGTGISRQGQLPGSDAYALAAEAFKAAIDDAGLEKEDIDGISVRALDPIHGSAQEVARTLGLNPPFLFTGQFGGASTTIAIQQAALAIHHGLAKTVAVVYACNNRSVRRRFNTPRYEHHAPYGHFGPGARLALAIHRYFHDYYGLEKSDEDSLRPLQQKLGALAVAARRHASLTPHGYIRKPMTIEQYLDDRYIVWPLRRPDYALISDGGGCLILTSAERARDMKKPPILISGMGQGHVPRAQEHPSYILQRQMEGMAAEGVYRSSGLGPSDMDAMYVYDSFTILSLFALENFGICKPGEGLEFIQNGRTEFDGAFPLNTNGGHTAESYIGGILHYVEAARQMWGEAGPRQIKKRLDTILCTGEGTGGTDAGAVILRKG